jgi:pimeloyl-ACP methyl ester carboxylesterase
MRSDAVARDCQLPDAGAQAPACNRRSINGSRAMSFNFRIAGAILRKDALILFPLVLLTILLLAGDVFFTRLDVFLLWPLVRQALIGLSVTALVLSVFQLDSPVGLTDDWLCRPVPRRELLTAKLLLVLSVLYLSPAVATFIVDLVLDLPWVEALQDALLLQDPYFLLPLPVLLITAMVTRNLVQGIGALIALVVCVFLIPGPFIATPGPLSPGIGEAVEAAGLRWIMLVPAKLVPLLLVALVCWLVYWRKRIALARAMLVFTTCVTVLFVVAPMWLLPWEKLYALQRATLPEAARAAADVADRIQLRNPRACFPATRIRNLSSDVAFSAARKFHDVRLWSEEALRAAGQDSLAFVTSIEVTSLPLDWRVKLNYVQADVLAEGNTAWSLRPAHYITDYTGGGTLSHTWMLPGSVVKDVAARTDPTLRLSYSVTLLEPRNFSLPVDGRRHALPGFGRCTARVNALGNSIDVDCFSASRHAAQLSAELNRIPASRVYSMADLSPRWTQLPSSQRIKLSIGSPRLAQHDSITVSTWEVAGYLDKSLTLPGVLGDKTDTCPLPALDGNSFQQASWRDAAPHQTHSIQVDEGVQLEVLDFGGNGSAMLLLPGLGATAHTFDDFAPLLTPGHRVIAMTRRGTGYSSKPDFGFDTPTLARDILRVIDAMKLEKPLLVGSSIAGDELTWLGGHHADRLSGLVYLDAAYDRSVDPASTTERRMRELNRSLPPEPPVPPQALLNYDAMSIYMDEHGYLQYPEGELIALLNINNPFLAGAPSIDALTQQAISAGINSAPDYAAVSIPALAIYAITGPDEPLPYWYDRSDRQLLATLAELDHLGNTKKRKSIELFRTGLRNGKVLELLNSKHMIYLSNPQQVRQAIEDFASSLRP